MNFRSCDHGVVVGLTSRKEMNGLNTLTEQKITAYVEVAESVTTSIDIKNLLEQTFSPQEVDLSTDEGCNKYCSMFSSSLNDQSTLKPFDKACKTAQDNFSFRLRILDGQHRLIGYYSSSS